MYRIHAARVGALVVAFVAVLAARVDAATHVVPAGADLQAILDLAQPGDSILLTPGATYIGNFRLPVKPGTAFITLRTDAPSRDVPPAGVRITPGHAAVLAKLRSPNTSATLTAAPGAHHWRIELVEFQANARGAGDIIVLGGGGTQTHESQMPHTLIFDRVYIHGDADQGQKRGIALNSAHTQIVNSHISDMKSTGQDSQAIAGWNGSGPYLIENNYLEASGENVAFGGADPSIPNLVPSDITVRRNTLSKPLEWRQQRWLVKNAFQLKNARRVLIEGNIFEHVWRSGQSGFAIVFTPRNQDGRAPWSVVEDVTFRYNVVRHAGGGINLTGYDDVHPSARTERIQIAHNIFYDIDDSWGGAGVFLQVGSSPRDVLVERNTVLHSGNAVAAHGRRNGQPWPIEQFVFRDNLMRHNRYGVIGDNEGVGRATLDVYFAGLVFTGNVLAGGNPSLYPPGNHFPSVAEFDSMFVDAPAGNLALVDGARLAASSTGGPPGADVARVHAAITGAAAAAGDEGYAVCRPGRFCAPQDPYSSRRPRR